MAKRSFNQKARALQPAVMKLHFAVPLNGVNHVVDLSECTSRLNRRFMRQGLNWAVANVRLTTMPSIAAATGADSYVNTIPHTWSVANAWMKAFSAWRLQQDEAMADGGSESAIARFRDFKISMEGAVPTKLSPISIGPGTIVGPFQTGLIDGPQILPSEEWQNSEIVIPNDGAPGLTNEYELHMVGADSATSKGLIAGYAASRSFPQSPDPVSPTIGSADNWIRSMFDTGDDTSDVANNAAFRNNELPYDQTEYPGGDLNFIQLECQGYNLNQSSVGLNSWNTGPFTAPCGLIRFDFLNQLSLGGGDSNHNIITIELVPGSHRGYLCETMEEF